MSNDILNPQELLTACEANYANGVLSIEHSHGLKEAILAFKATYPAINNGIDSQDMGVEIFGHTAQLFMAYLDELVKLKQTGYVKIMTFHLNQADLPKEMLVAMYKEIPYILKGPWCVVVDKDLRLFSRRYLANEAVKQIDNIKRITERRLRYIANGEAVSIVGGRDGNHLVGVLCEAKGDIHLGWTECTIAFSAGGNLVEYKTYHRSEIRPFSTKKNDLDKLGQSLWDTLEGKLVRS